MPHFITLSPKPYRYGRIVATMVPLKVRVRRHSGKCCHHVLFLSCQCHPKQILPTKITTTIYYYYVCFIHLLDTGVVQTVSATFTTDEC